MPGTQLRFENGQPVNDICHRCQRPGTDVRLEDGELYCADCAGIILDDS